ncbi:hypothetical protein EJ02DRAFT_486073 [Clathrospora elynae]|uniref:Uncharacterized protein n=1 Tax=Clathrospora elynae TaxID=706981 RepID=A0A6A5TEF6_9PLEO|nr:hypothetical protein EJ02DRAFT_486073 [Clathrospora elynae]
MPQSGFFQVATIAQQHGRVCGSCSSNSKDVQTPTQRSHNDAESYMQQPHTKTSTNNSTPDTSTNTMFNINPGPRNIYIVTDTWYPTASSLKASIGTTTILSAHSTKSAANARAKKTIYENDGGCSVDVNKIIEEVKKGLYTGIGVGGKEEKEGGCFARKCEVEGRIVDEDSDSEEGSGGSEGVDVEMF